MKLLVDECNLALGIVQHRPAGLKRQAQMLESKVDRQPAAAVKKRELTRVAMKRELPRRDAPGLLSTRQRLIEPLHGFFTHHPAWQIRRNARDGNVAKLPRHIQILRLLRRGGGISELAIKVQIRRTQRQFRAEKHRTARPVQRRIAGLTARYIVPKHRAIQRLNRQRFPPLAGQRQHPIGLMHLGNPALGLFEQCQAQATLPVCTADHRPIAPPRHIAEVFEP